MRMRLSYFIVIAWLLGCAGSSSGAGARAAGASPPAARRNDSAATAPSDAGDPTDARRRAGLDRLCAATTRALGDRSRPLSVRVRELREATRADPDMALAVQALDGRDDAAREAHSACPAFQRLEQLQRAHDDDIDPALAAPLAADLERLCTILGDVGRDGDGDPARRAQVLAERLADEITNPELRARFAALEQDPPAQRRTAFERWVRTTSARNFRCAHLDVLFGPRP